GRPTLWHLVVDGGGEIPRKLSHPPGSPPGAGRKNREDQKGAALGDDQAPAGFGDHAPPRAPLVLVRALRHPLPCPGHRPERASAPGRAFLSLPLVCRCDPTAASPGGATKPQRARLT